MRFTSTRNKKSEVSFEKAIRNCMPSDGGLYVPSDVNDLRRWFLYTNEKTSYASVVGALTLACVNEEFSPIICEAIATQAFDYEPVLRRLDEHLYTLELFHGPTGWHQDFGVSYLVEALENILLLNGGKALIFDVTTSALSMSLAKALKDKKNVKAVILYPKNNVTGIEPEDCVWNGGNIYPVEIDGSIEDCHKIVHDIFADEELVSKLGITVANTANIGRLFPQACFYPFAFSRLKKEVFGDIYYAMSPGNFSNVVAGLYSWKTAMPVSGFILPATDQMTVDATGKCTILDSLVPLQQRNPCDPSSPLNIERLEEVFAAGQGLMQNLIYTSKITEQDIENAAKELFIKYGLYTDRDTASAYAATKYQQEVIEQDEGALVLVARNHPSLDWEFIRHCTGETPVMPENVAKSVQKVVLNRPLLKSSDQIISVLEQVHASF